MKRIVLSIAALVGVGGLVALLSYHPQKAQVGKQSATAAVDGSPSPAPTAATAAAGNYRDGSYTGQTSDTVYGPVQVQAVISAGRITDVNFLQLPNDRRDSQEISAQAMPILLQEALQAQSGKVDVVSGATQTSEGFQQSLDSALAQAKA